MSKNVSKTTKHLTEQLKNNWQIQTKPQKPAERINK